MHTYVLSYVYVRVYTRTCYLKNVHMKSVYGNTNQYLYGKSHNPMKDFRFKLKRTRLMGRFVGLQQIADRRIWRVRIECIFGGEQKRCAVLSDGYASIRPQAHESFEEILTANFRVG